MQIEVGVKVLIRIAVNSDQENSLSCRVENEQKKIFDQQIFFVPLSIEVMLENT